VNRATDEGDRRRAPYVAVVGAGEASVAQLADAREAGRLLAERGAVVVTGGLGGVMGAAAEGVADAGGTSIGLLPGPDRGAAHPAHTLALPTGLGELRNGLVVRGADAVLAIGGSWGTLSEIALAVRTGVPVVGLGTWQLAQPGVLAADGVQQAVQLVLALAAGELTP